MEGIEAQAWNEEALVASRWWPQLPDPEEAQVWLRSLGPLSNGTDALPAAAPVTWHRRPWLELESADDLRSTSSRLERIAIGSALVGFAALSGAQAHQAFAAYDERQSLQRELERMRLEAAPVLAARDRAESMARELQGLALQLTGVLPLELLQHLSEVLPPRGVTLKELDLSGQRLRLSLELAADLQHSALVKQLQAGGWLTKVTEARDTSSRGWIVFDAELSGHRAPVVAARSVMAASAPSPAAPAPVAASQAAAQRP
jgi:Tfp pilus assembly protein PilN